MEITKWILKRRGLPFLWFRGNCSQVNMWSICFSFTKEDAVKSNEVNWAQCSSWITSNNTSCPVITLKIHSPAIALLSVYISCKLCNPRIIPLLCKIALLSPIEKEIKSLKKSSLPRNTRTKLKMSFQVPCILFSLLYQFTQDCSPWAAPGRKFLHWLLEHVLPRTTGTREHSHYTAKHPPLDLTFINKPRACDKICSEGESSDS